MSNEPTIEQIVEQTYQGPLKTYGRLMLELVQAEHRMNAASPDERDELRRQSGVISTRLHQEIQRLGTMFCQLMKLANESNPDAVTAIMGQPISDLSSELYQMREQIDSLRSDVAEIADALARIEAANAERQDAWARYAALQRY